MHEAHTVHCTHDFSLLFFLSFSSFLFSHSVTFRLVFFSVPFLPFLDCSTFFSCLCISIQLFIISFVLRHNFLLLLLLLLQCGFYCIKWVFFSLFALCLYTLSGLWFLCNFAREPIVIVRFISMRVCCFFLLCGQSNDVCHQLAICGMTIHQLCRNFSLCVCSLIKVPIKSNFRIFLCFTLWVQHFRQRFLFLNHLQRRKERYVPPWFRNDCK